MAVSSLESISSTERPSGWATSRFVEGRTTRDTERLIRELADEISGGKWYSLSNIAEGLQGLLLKGHRRRLAAAGLTGVAAVVESGCAGLVQMAYDSGAPRIESDYLDLYGFSNGARSSFPRKLGPHNGIDIGVPIGHPVLAAADGVVIFSGWDCCGGGNVVTIEHGQDKDGNYIRTVYFHNETNLVKKGQEVKRGQKIALSGKTGPESGDYPHLHYGVFRGKTPRQWDSTWNHVTPHDYWLGLDEHKEMLKAGKGDKTFVIPCFRQNADANSSTPIKSTYPAANSSNRPRFTYPVECRR